MARDPRNDDAAETPLVPAAWRVVTPDLGGGTRFVLAFLLLVGLQAAAVGAINVTVDPRAEFGTGLLPPLIADTAQMRVHLLDRVDQEPRTLILGNSRAMTMGSDHVEALGHPPVFNFAIGGSSASDALTIYRFMQGEGYPLEQVVYGVDMIQVQSFKGDNRKMATTPALTPYVNNGTDQATTWDKVRGSLNQGYVWDSLRSVALEIAGRPPPTTTYTDDGQVVKADLEAALAAGTFDADAWVHEDLTRIEDKLEDPHGRTSIDLRPVEDLIQQARQDDVEVRLFIPPLHPDLQAELEGASYRENRTALRQGLAELCRPGVHLHDLEDIDTFGGREDRFYDAWHAFGENHRLVAQALTDPLLDLCAT